MKTIIRKLNLMRKIMITIFFLCITATCFSQTFTDNGLNYNVISTNPNEVEITGGTFTNPLTIPSTVTDGTDNYTVTTVGNSAFRNKFVTSVIFPSTLTTISFRAFRDNGGLTSITLPASVTAISTEAFAFGGLNEIIAQGTVPASINNGSFGARSAIDVTIPAGFEQTYADRGWTGFATVNGVLPIGGFFTEGDLRYTITTINPNTVEVRNRATTTQAISIPDVITDSNSATSYAITGVSNTAFRNTDITSVVLGNNITTIGTESFRNTQLTIITIPASVTAIGQTAFKDNALSSITVASSVPVSIGTNTFNNRSQTNLTVPNGTETAYAAAGWTDFFSVNGVSIIGTNFTVDGFNYTINGINPNTVQLNGGTTTLDLILPNTVTKNSIAFTITVIGTGAFRSKNLNSVELPSTLKIIATAAFEGNNITSITFPASLNTIDDNAFLNNQLTSADFPNNLTSLGVNSFQNNQLNSITLSNTLTTIGQAAFSDNQLTSVDFPNSLTSLGASAFRNNQLNSIVVPNSITTIEANTFRENVLTSITLSNTLVTIGQTAFSDNQLTSITIPSTITSLENDAFARNPLASVIADSATPATIESNSFGERKNINLTIPASSLTDYENAGWTGFFSVNGQTSNGAIGVTFIENGINYEITSANPNEVEVIGGSVTGDLIIPAQANFNSSNFSVKTVVASAFQNDELTSVTLPSSITTIGASAFTTDTLTQVTALGTTPAIIESDSFGERDRISLTILESTVTAYENAGWTGFFSVNGSTPLVGSTFSVDGIRYEILSLSPNIVKAIGVSGAIPNGNYTFPELLSKDDFDFTITTIGNSAFRNIGVTTLSLPSTVTTIEFRGFRDNQNLTSVTIPANITAIGNEAFFDNRLTEVISEIVNPPNISGGTFGDRSVINLFIPEGTTQAYIDANWTGFLSIIEIGTLTLEPKVFLQGAFQNPIVGEETLMRDNLRVANLIPTTSPYSDGATCESTVFNVTGDNAIVDWVFVELRDALNNTIIIESQSALLQRDGDVVDTNGKSILQFTSPLATYFIVLKHRNHLGIMTANVVSLTGTRNTVNFTNAINQIAFGSNAQTTAGMPVDTVGMWAGNVNSDTIVQYSGTTPDAPNILSTVLNDVGNFLNFPTFIVNGYDANDINMDGKIQYTGTTPDAPFILQNVLAHPGNFLNFSTFQIQEQLPEN